MNSGLLENLNISTTPSITINQKNLSRPHASPLSLLILSLSYKSFETFCTSAVWNLHFSCVCCLLYSQIKGLLYAIDFPCIREVSEQYDICSCKFHTSVTLFFIFIFSFYRLTCLHYFPLPRIFVVSIKVFKVKINL